MDSDDERLKEVAMKPDFSDLCPNGSVYFDCGLGLGGDGCTINYTFMKAIEAIGRKHRSTAPKCSNWHCGVAVVAEKAQVSKSQVKSFRRQFYRMLVSYKGYVYKTPDATGRIVEAVIVLLKEALHAQGAARLLGREGSGVPFRDALLGDQLTAVRNAASASHGMSIRIAKRARQVCEDLDELVGGEWDMP